MKTAKTNRFAKLFAAVLCACVAACAAPEPLPPCPGISIEKNTATAVAFDPADSTDITDQLYMAELVAVEGECEYNDDRTKIAMTLNPVFAFTKGPASAVNQVEFSYYVAIPQFYPKPAGKNIFTSSVVFPPNVEQVRFRDEDLALFIPLQEGLTGYDYDVFVGFQLTDKQLEFNRKRANRNR